VLTFAEAAKEKVMSGEGLLILLLVGVVA